MNKNLEEKKIVCALSGGIDSTTLLFHMVKEYGKKNVYAVSFDYGQKNSIEIEMAKRSVKAAQVNHKIISLDFLKEINENTSSLMKNGPCVPTLKDVEKGEELTTYLPFRNMIIASILFSYAEAIKANSIAMGIQFGDYEKSEYAYWDCSDKFLKRLQDLADLNDKRKIQIKAPFVNLKKGEIVKHAIDLKVPIENTWSCYDPRLKDKKYFPCGVCPTCENRKKAFEENKIKDPAYDGVSI